MPCYPFLSINSLHTIVKIIPKNWPKLINNPVLKLSPIGYVNSTPKLNDTAVIGTIENPCKKDMIPYSHVCLEDIKIHEPIVKRVENTDIPISVNLYFLVFSTYTPMYIEPSMPPITNKAPKILESYEVNPNCAVASLIIVAKVL